MCLDAFPGNFSPAKPKTGERNVFSSLSPVQLCRLYTTIEPFYLF